MTAPLAFHFDARFCTGCKACQAACKDKNNLPPGVLWRRVYEVSGGGWTQTGAAWTNTVFAYNLSFSCGHCEYPKCAGVCPVDAYHVRPDGIVLLDSSRCMGCGYCAWACPYGAPQYDPAAGTMSKCDFCYDQIDAGLPPACAAACPLRALDYRKAAALPGTIALWESPASDHPFPLPSYSRTEPHLAVTPHAAMSLPHEKRLANLEEIRPRPHTGLEEAPLVGFTLLAQMAVGGFWSMLWMFPLLWSLVQYYSLALWLAPLIVIGLCLALGLAASFAHLGAKRNAWRAPFHLKKSWLSREILSALLFGAGWLLAAWMSTARGTIPPWAAGLVSLLGAGLLFSMARVYHLRAVPAWNTWRTEASFLISALLLGGLLMAVILAFESRWTGIQIPAARWQLMMGGALVLLAARGLMRTGASSHPQAARAWRTLLLGSIVVSAILLLAPWIISGGTLSLLFLLALCEEALGRWLFYEAHLNP